MKAMEKTKELSKKEQYFYAVIAEMKQSIIVSLKTLEKGCGINKKGIAIDTGIPVDMLTPLLRQLKYEGKIELMMFWNEETGMPNGSGYCLTPTLTLDQAVEKAKPNMDKIKDVDAHLNRIK